MEDSIPLTGLGTAAESFAQHLEAMREVARSLHKEAERLPALLQEHGKRRQEDRDRERDQIASLSEQTITMTGTLLEGAEAVEDKFRVVQQGLTHQAGEVGAAGALANRALDACSDRFHTDLVRLDGQLAQSRDQAQQRSTNLDRDLRQITDLFDSLKHGIDDLGAELGKATAQSVRHHDQLREAHRRRAARAADRHAIAGWRALQTGSPEAAATHFRAAWEAAPAPATLFNLIIALVGCGQIEEAGRLLSEPALNQCDPFDLQVLKAVRALHAGEPALALKEAESGLHLRPDHLLLRHLASTAALVLGSTTGALRLLEASGDSVAEGEAVGVLLPLATPGSKS